MGNLGSVGSWCVAGVLLYSQHFLILHCLFLPQATAVRDDTATHPSSSGQNRSRDNGCGQLPLSVVTAVRYHWEWTTSFLHWCRGRGVVFSSVLEWGPKWGSHWYTTVQITWNYSAGLGEMAWGQCTKRCATLQMLNLEKLYTFHQKGNLSAQGMKAAKKQPCGYSVRKRFCNYILLLKSYPLKF